MPDSQVRGGWLSTGKVIDVRVFSRAPTVSTQATGRGVSLPPAAVEKAATSLRDLRIAEVAELDLQIEDGRLKAYRAKVKVSFKYED